MGNRGRALLHSCRRQWMPILASQRWGGSGSSARAARQRGELNSGATGRSGSPRRLLYGGGRSAGGDRRGGGGWWSLAAGCCVGKAFGAQGFLGWCRGGRRRTGAGWHHGGPWRRWHNFSRTLRHLCLNDNGASLGLEGGGGARGTAARALTA
jgi:hypothetical protein